MKILHTADWHLGKKLDFYSRYEEQKTVLDEICTIADREQVDLVLVAGDLFDNFNPPVEAIELLYATLNRLTNFGKRPVLAIAGNHDAPDRVDAPDILAKTSGILFVGKPNMTFQPFEVSGGFQITKGDCGFLEIQLPNFSYPVRIITTPFANEHRLKTYLGADEQLGLNQVLSASWQKLADTYCDAAGVNLLTAHLYMNKKGGPVLEEPEGERPLKVGFADIVYTDCIPDQIQYSALGHLHRFQNVGGAKGPVVYSSSPLCYSFSEAGQQKMVVIVEAEPNHPVAYRPVEICNGKELKRVTFHNLEDALEWLEKNLDDLVELTIKTPVSLSQSERKQIEKAHQGIIYLKLEVQKKKLTQDEQIEIEAKRHKSVQENFISYYKSKYNDQIPSADLLDVFKEVVALTDKEQ